MIFRIDTTAISNHVERLTRMNKSALPVVVRQTLNAAAFRTKTDTMPKEAAIFIPRKRTFFQANSKVSPAQGLNINTMTATVGFVPKQSDKSHSVEDLQAQETGGSIRNRSFVALPGARTGGVWQGLTANKNRRQGKGIALDSKDFPGKSPEEQFIHAAYEAAMTGKLLIGNRVNSRGNKIAWRVKPIAKQGQKGGARMVMTFQKKYVENQVFAVKAGRRVMPKATHFMRRASDESAKLMEMDFGKFANAKLATIK